MNRIVYVLSGYCLFILLLAAFGVIGTNELGLYGSIIDLVSNPTHIKETIFWKGIFTQFALTAGSFAIVAFITSLTGLIGGNVSQLFWRDPKLILSTALMGSIIVPLFESFIQIWILLNSAFGSALFGSIVMIPFLIPMILVVYDWWKN